MVSLTKYKHVHKLTTPTNIHHNATSVHIDNTRNSVGCHMKWLYFNGLFDGDFYCSPKIADMSVLIEIHSFHFNHIHTRDFVHFKSYRYSCPSNLLSHY